MEDRFDIKDGVAQNFFQEIFLSYELEIVQGIEVLLFFGMVGVVGDKDVGNPSPIEFVGDGASYEPGAPRYNDRGFVSGKFSDDLNAARFAPGRHRV